MKAIVYTTYGPPAVLQLKNLPRPNPGSDEILVRVFASTVNRTDCAMLRAKPFIMRFVTGLFRPKKIIPGTDFAGRIEAVGDGIRSFKVGDRVFGFDDNGLSSKAEYLVINESKGIDLVPRGVSYEEAAASIEGAHYAYNFINKVELKEGDWVLINGATGAIGSAMLQLVKYFGAQVTAVCNTKNIKKIRSLGADRVIDYLNEDFTKDKQKYNFVFDTVGKSSFAQCRSLLQPRGVYISSELGWMAQNVFLALITPLFGGKKVAFPVPTNTKKSVLLVKELMKKGQFKPLIDRTYRLEEIVEAYEYVETGMKTGNVVVKIGESSSKPQPGG